MALKFPPAGTPEWKRYVEQVKIQHRTDIQRLWQVAPQVPEPQAGIPFTGGTDPEVIEPMCGTCTAYYTGFVWFTSGCTGSCHCVFDNSLPAFEGEYRTAYCIPT